MLLELFRKTPLAVGEVLAGEGDDFLIPQILDVDACLRRLVKAEIAGCHAIRLLGSTIGIDIQSIGMGCTKFELTAFDGEATFVTCGKAGGKTMGESGGWRHMASAPKDGSRILVTIRPSEQGPAEVDLAYWSKGDQFAGEGWRASDSSPGQVIEYAEPELKCWMPMPAANLNRTSMPSPWEGDDDQNLDGSGI